MSSLRKALGALAIGTLATVGLLVPASAAHASSSGCNFTMDTVKSRNLENDGGTDYVWLEVDTSWYPNNNTGVQYVNTNITHTDAAFGNPYMGFGSGGLQVQLVLDSWGLHNHRIGTFTVACNPGTNKVHTFDDGDGLYDLTYDVS